MPQPIRLIHFADLHLGVENYGRLDPETGVSGRVKDFLKCLDFLVETALAEEFDKPVFVHHYPTRCKAFYMEEEPDRPEVCRSVDLLAPEGYGEIIGGGERTASLELLERRIREHNLPREAYEWYLDLRRYGSVPHSGFGLGVERTVMWICGLPHIRETIPFPRLLERIYP